jgi:hypothetical protein
MYTSAQVEIIGEGLAGSGYRTFKRKRNSRPAATPLLRLSPTSLLPALR